MTSAEKMNNGANHSEAMTESNTKGARAELVKEEAKQTKLARAGSLISSYYVRQ